MNNTLLRNVLLAVLSLFVLVSCSSSSETIVIDDAPTGGGQTDTTVQNPQPAGAFQQLTIGENQPIRTLDPLFVENASGMRAVQLLYEGLVRYGPDGNIEPAIARSWDVQDDGTTYRFTLHNDLFYHDSNIFSNGRGRRLIAADVQRVFERMTRSTVPRRAAQLFMNIEGFEPYFREQHELLLPGDRQLQSISGIETPTDSTVVFTLNRPDERFLQKLASPYAVVYPHEALSGGRMTAVGTGPFRLSQQRSDSLYIFAKFDNYRVDEQPHLDRIDLVTSASEQALLDAMSRGEIQLIPELGPRQMAMALNAGGQLRDRLSEQYRLYGDNGSSSYFLRYYPQADRSPAEVAAALAPATGQTLFNDIPDTMYRVLWSLPNADGRTPQSLTAAYTSDPFIRNFYESLSRILANGGTDFTMRSSRIPNRNIPLYTEPYLPYYSAQMSTTPPHTLATVTIQSGALARKSVQGLAFNSLGWWIDLRNVTLRSTSNDHPQ